MNIRDLVQKWLEVAISEVYYFNLIKDFDLDIEDAFELEDAIRSMRVSFELEDEYED